MFKIFAAQTTGLAAFTLTAASALSYCLGMVRDIVFARFYGAGLVSDAYNAGFLVPDAIFNLFVAGALTAAFIPVFSAYLSRQKKEEAADLASGFLAAASLVVAAASLLAYFFLPQIVAWYFTGADQEKIALTISLSRILLLSSLLFTISNTIGNVLLAHKHFFSYAFAPLFYNLGIIGGMFFFAADYGIYAAAWGAVAGVFLHLCVRLLELPALGFRFGRVGAFWRHPGLKQIALLMLPKTVGLMSWQLSLFAINIIGNRQLGDGAVSAFYYAKNLQSFPVSVFGIALATAVFPYLSDHAAAGRKAIFTHQYAKSLRQILFLTLPAALGVWLLADPIVKLIYGHGAFDEQDALVTASVLAWFAFSIPVESAVHLAARAFYSRQNTLVPVCGALLLMSAVILGSWLLADTIGAAAFALFFTAGSLLQLIWLWVMLRPHLVDFPLRSFLAAGGKILLACSALAVAVLFAGQLSFEGETLLLVQISAGASAYLLFAFCFGCGELSEVKAILLRRSRSQTVSDRH